MRLITLLYEVVSQAFFDKVKTPEEAKALYKELAKKYHPDRGGNTEIMQAINNQYQEFLKNTNKHSSIKTNATSSYDWKDDADKAFYARQAEKAKQYFSAADKMNQKYNK